MELAWLKTFADAVETLNFRETSERLLMSQPNVTVHVRLLEESLGVKLFNRIKTRIALTEEGKLFKEEVNAILTQLDSSVERLHAYAGGYRKKWTLAISPLTAETVLPYILKAFTQEHPSLELAIQVEESVRIEELVNAGEVSIGISALQPVRRSLIYRDLYEDPLLFIVPRDAYDEESGPVIQPAEVLGTNYLFTGHHPVFWEDLLVKLRNEVKGIRTMEVSQAHIVKRFIEEGLGVSFLPKSVVRRELLEGRLIEAPFQLFPLPVVSTYLVAKEMDELTEEFIKRIQSVYFK